MYLMGTDIVNIPGHTKVLFVMDIQSLYEYGQQATVIYCIKSQYIRFSWQELMKHS